jgi:hypothetical protein
MKRLRLFLVLLLCISLVTTPSFAAVKAGAKCIKVGATSTTGGKKFTCIKSGSKLVWNKGVAIKATAPKLSATPTPEPKVEAKSILANDFRITPISALTAAEFCKTEDMTPDYLEGGILAHRNGFPRPTNTVYGKKVGKLLIIPMAFNDLPFRIEKLQRGQVFSSDIDLLNETIPNVKESIKKLSASRFELVVDVLPQSEWWSIDSDNPFSGVWGVDNFSKVKEIINKYKSSFRFEDYDTYAFVTGNGLPGQPGLGSAQASFGLPVKNSKTGSINAVLLTGGLTNATIWVHELGHSLFSLEDLYLFSQAGSNSPRERAAEVSVPSKWDLMSDSNRPTLLGWNKLLMGWLYDSEVRCIAEQKSSVHYLSGVATDKNPKLLTINLSPGVTLAAEAKYALGTDLGLLLYTVNSHIPHGEGPLLSQNSVIPKGGTKSWLGWQFSVLDVDDGGVLFEATKTDIDKFVPPAPKPKPSNQQPPPNSRIQVTKGDIVPNGYLKARATWDVKGHKSYRLYVTATDDFQKVFFESGFVNDDRNQIVVDISGLACNREMRTITEFFTEKDGKGERFVVQNKQVSFIPCEDTTKKP